jgi:hypothetical protein
MSRVGKIPRGIGAGMLYSVDMIFLGGRAGASAFAMCMFWSRFTTSDELSLPAKDSIVGFVRFDAKDTRCTPSVSFLSQ